MIIWLSHLPFVVVVVLGVGSPGTRIRKRETGEGEGGKKSSCCFVSGGFIVPERYFSLSLSLCCRRKITFCIGPPAVKQVGILSLPVCLFFSVVVAAGWQKNVAGSVFFFFFFLYSSHHSSEGQRHHAAVHLHTVQSYTYTLCVCVCVSFLWSFSCCVRICQSNNSSRRMTRRNFYLFL